MKKSLSIAAAFLVAVPLAHADEKHHQAAPAANATQAASPDFDGEVRRVDKNAKKITLKHGPMPRLEMPPMTMVFQVKDAALLEKVKPGDKVKFDAQKTGGALVVTRIEPVR